MSTETAHALLGPSSASRWLACTPSARLEEQFPDKAGAAAAEGTLAHALGELSLRRYFHRLPEYAYANQLNAIEADQFYNADMQEHIDEYTTFVIEQYNEALAKSSGYVKIDIEAKIDLTEYIPEGFGTGDAIIIADNTLHIIDLKYGKGVPVSCERNKQMMLYALGAFNKYSIAFDISSVEMTIYQPRLNNVSTYSMPVEDLLEWAIEELKPRADMAFKGEGEFVAGKHCQFCKAKNQCRALAKYNMELAKYEFRTANLLTDEEISDILTRGSEFKKWIDALEDYAQEEAIENGKKWPGFKLVEGRSVRTYTDTEAVASTLIRSGYPESIIYQPRSILGITAMEKAITKKAFEDLLTGYVVKPQGKPTLVPTSDKRPEYNSVSSAINDFANIND